MIFNKGKFAKSSLIIISVLTCAFMGACNTPTAPLQAADGTVYSYTKNYRLKQSTTQATSVSKATDGTVTVNGMPIFKQGDDNTCGQATMASILNFWGVKTSYQTVINETNFGNMPTDLGVIETYLQNKGLKAKAYKKSSVAYLKSLVDLGKPPIVLLDFGGLSNEHYVVVSGYNTKKDTILYNDSRNGPFISIKTATFVEMWKNHSLGNLLIFGDKFDSPIFDISAE